MRSHGLACGLFPPYTCTPLQTPAPSLIAAPPAPAKPLCPCTLPCHTQTRTPRAIVLRALDGLLTSSMYYNFGILGGTTATATTAAALHDLLSSGLVRAMLRGLSVNLLGLGCTAVADLAWRRSFLTFLSLTSGAGPGLEKPRAEPSSPKATAAAGSDRAAGRGAQEGAAAGQGSGSVSGAHSRAA